MLKRNKIIRLLTLVTSLTLAVSCSIFEESGASTQTITVIQTNYTYVTNFISQTNLTTNTIVNTNLFVYTNALSFTNIFTNVMHYTNSYTVTNLQWFTNFSTNLISLTNSYSNIIDYTNYYSNFVLYTNYFTNTVTYTNTFENTNLIIATNVHELTNYTQISNINNVFNYITNVTETTNLQFLTNMVIITNYYTMTNSLPIDLSDSSQIQLFGAVMTNGISSSALFFDGSNYAAITNQDSINFTGDKLTISAWVQWKHDPFDWGKNFQNFANIISKNGDSQWQIGHGNNNRKFQFTLQTTTGSFVVASATQPQVDVWYHVAGVYDGNNIYLYINGVLENSSTADGLILPSDSDVNIGRRSVLDDRYFRGFVDRLGIYSTAWSTESVQFEYLSGI